MTDFNYTDYFESSDSTSISALWYNQNDSNLAVMWQSSHYSYVYEGVTKSQYETLRWANSVGSAVYSLVRNLRLVGTVSPDEYFYLVEVEVPEARSDYTQKDLTHTEASDEATAEHDLGEIPISRNRPGPKADEPTVEHDLGEPEGDKENVGNSEGPHLSFEAIADSLSSLDTEGLLDDLYVLVDDLSVVADDVTEIIEEARGAASRFLKSVRSRLG